MKEKRKNGRKEGRRERRTEERMGTSNERKKDGRIQEWKRGKVRSVKLRKGMERKRL